MQRSGIVSFDALVQAFDRFHFTPEGSARYDVDARAAAGQLRVLPEQMAELVAQGLPCRMDPELGPLFDLADVMNLGRASGTGRTAAELVWSYLMSFSSGPPQEWLSARDWLLTVRLPSGPGRFQVSVPDWNAQGITQLPAPGLRLPAAGTDLDDDSYQAAVRVTGELGEVRDARAKDVYLDMLNDLDTGKVFYQCVGEPLRLDHERAWELGMADCMVVSRLIAGRFRELGLAARARRGFFLGPVGSEHAWCEVHEDGRWKTVDVGFAFRFPHFPAGRRHPQTEEFIAACFGSRFNRLVPSAAENAASILYDNSQPRSMLRAFVAGTTWKESR